MNNDYKTEEFKKACNKIEEITLAKVEKDNKKSNAIARRAEIRSWIAIAISAISLIISIFR